MDHFEVRNLLLPGETRLSLKAICSDGTNTLFIAFRCRKDDGHEPPVYCVRAIDLLRGDLVPRVVYSCNADGYPTINGVGYVCATRTLLVYSFELREREEGKRIAEHWLIAVAQDEKRQWNVRHRKQITEDWYSQQVHFSELTLEKRVVCGDSGFFNDSSQMLHVYEVNAEHQIHSMKRITTPKRYCSFDARDVSGRTLVALAHYTEGAVIIYELKSDKLTELYHKDCSEQPPAHVLWCGDRLLAAGAETSDRYWALSRKRTSTDEIECNAVLSAKIIDKWAPSEPRSWLLRSVGDRLVVFDYEDLPGHAEHIWIFSLKNAKQFD